MSNFAEYKYNVSGVEGFTLTEALRLWKTKYEDDIRDFHKDVCNHPSMNEFAEFVIDMWDSIKVIDVSEAFQVPNAEKRRVYFDCIGVSKLMAKVNPELLDRQVINKRRAAWDDDNKHIVKEFEDVYELYKVPKEVLFAGVEDKYFRANSDAYVVRCWCTTTNREYWLYVAAPSYRLVQTGDTSEYKIVTDAIERIAWTIRIDIKNPERIYRQGDIIIVKKGPESVKTTAPYHLSKEEYLNLMYSES